MSRKRSYYTRVYSNQPHAHLLEEGHRQMLNPLREHKYIGKENASKRGIEMGRLVEKGKNKGQQIGRVPGRSVMAKAAANFEPVFNRQSESMIEEMIEKL